MGQNRVTQVFGHLFGLVIVTRTSLAMLVGQLLLDLLHTVTFSKGMLVRKNSCTITDVSPLSDRTFVESPALLHMAYCRQSQSSLWHLNRAQRARVAGGHSVSRRTGYGGEPWDWPCIVMPILVF